jgi:hypothetical protein
MNHRVIIRLSKGLMSSSKAPALKDIVASVGYKPKPLPLRIDSIEPAK